MRAAIYNPYFDTLGGGERYTLAVATTLAKNGFNVDIQWHEPSLKQKAEERFGISLNEINIVDNIKNGDGYDLCFWVSDGSVPLLRSRKNWLHFQVPFHNVGGKSLLNRMKLFRINKIISNSEFTKTIVDKEFGVNSLVIYPPVDTQSIKPRAKTNTILSVGRFSILKQKKGHETLINIFKKFYDQETFKSWILVIAGGVEVGSGGYVEMLEKQKKGYPIKIVKSPNFNELKKLYGTSEIFWTASGYGIDPESFPENVEHFGISTVEAMAGGCVILAYSAGGLKEIIREGENGYLWTTPDELIAKTKDVITNIAKSRKLVENARKDSENYSYATFEKKILQLL